MIEIDDAVKTLWDAEMDDVGLVEGDRLKTATMPYARYSVISSPVSERTNRGRFSEHTFQIDIFDQTKALVATHAAAAMIAFEGASLAPDDVSSLYCRATDEPRYFHEKTSEGLIWRAVLQFEVLVKI